MSLYNEIDRRTFLKLAGMGTAGLLLSENMVGCDRRGKNHEVFVPRMNNLSYWEMLMFSCLQGIANRDGPRIFLYYPDKTSESWDSRDSEDQKRIYYEWYQKYDFLQFTEVNSPYELFEKLKKKASLPFDGYVMVDTDRPITANIAANYAGIEHLLPLTPSILENHQSQFPDLPNKRDLRGQFKNMSKLEVYEWAYQNQWPQANHARVANLGTPKPAPADQIPVNSFYTSNRARDFTVAEQGFFFDLNSKGEDYELKDQILIEMEPHGYVFGWHQGAGETQHISQLSKHGQLALGASTYAANYSFYSRVKVDGAVERFKSHVVSNKTKEKELEEKIYLTFALSDGDSLNFINRKAMGGQWQMPQRGKIPFGWEIQPLLADVAPGILDYYQATATDNDYFVDGVSGIGYFYPQEMPGEVLRSVLAETKEYLDRTGLCSLTIMGPPSAVSEEKAQIYQDILGEQLSGVMEGYTRREADMVRLYRDEGGGFTSWLPTSNPKGDETVENWVKGLKKVARTRKQRPLFIPLHVPAHNLTIADMAEVLAQLGSEFEALSPDVFYTRFAEARKNSVLINPPESFPVEPISLKSGAMNTLNPTLQNLSEELKAVTVGLRINSETLSESINHQIKMTLKVRETRKTKFQISVPKVVHKKNGQLEYSVDEEQFISVPVQFS